MQTFIGIHPRYLPHVPKEWEWMCDEGKECVMKGKNEWRRGGMRDEQKECMTKGRNVWQNPKSVYVGGLRILVILRLCIRLGKYKINHTRSTTYKCIKKWLQSPKKLAKTPMHFRFWNTWKNRQEKAKRPDPFYFYIYLTLLVLFFFIVICKPVTTKNTA